MKDKIVKWIDEFVSVYNKDIDAIPCPFAKSAVLKNTIRYAEFTSDSITSELSNLGSNWNDAYEVVVLYAHASEMTPEHLSHIVYEFNKRFRETDIAALEDHPHDIEHVNGVSMNFGEGILILVQRLSKINIASEKLASQGYYDNWSQEYYDEVVGWRLDK